MTCRDCKHFAVANHKAYCRKRGDYLIPDGYSCPNFESAYQITTTRNPYLNQGSMLDVSFNVRKEYNKMFKMDKVKRVIFNPPATIVYWLDGTKTIVKTQNGEIFDKEKGFAMACAKKFFGNKGNYYNEFRKHGADNHCYSVHIDLAHPGEVVKSSIGDGISYDGAGSVSMSPNKIREMVGFPPISDIHEAAMPSAIREELEKSELDEKPVGSMLDISHRARIQKKKDRIDDIALDEAVNNNLYVEVVESNDGDVEYEFSFMHDDNRYKFTHGIGYDEFDNYSHSYLRNRLLCRVGAWLGELAKAGVEPEKKESE